MANPQNFLYKKINQLLLELLADLPRPQTSAISFSPESLIKTASLKAAAVSGALSLPSGVLAVLTLFPDIVAVWKIQAQLVADIAASNGKSNQLNRETLLYCLFGANDSASEDLVVRVGQRFVVRRSSQKVFESFLGKLGLRIGRSLMGERFARWIPLIGAALVARYSYNDTAKVGQTALELFSSVIEIQ